MKIPVLKTEDERKRAYNDTNFIADHYYTKGIVYAVALGHGIFEAWKPIKKVGKILSVYTGNIVSLEGKSHVSVRTEDDGPRDERFSRDTKLYGTEVYCKKLEAKGFKLPEEQLSEEDEKSYSDDLSLLSANPDLLESGTKEVLEARLAKVVLNKK